MEKPGNDDEDDAMVAALEALKRRGPDAAAEPAWDDFSRSVRVAWAARVEERGRAARLWRRLVALAATATVAAGVWLALDVMRHPPGAAPAVAVDRAPAPPRAAPVVEPPGDSLGDAVDAEDVDPEDVIENLSAEDLARAGAAFGKGA